MNYKEHIDKVKPEFDKAFKFLEGELAKIRTSRASPSLIEDIEVDCFGSKFSLKQLGAISAPQSNQLVIQPWDISYIEPIERAISQSGLGMSVAADKNIIRLNLPLLTEEYRQGLAKILNEKGEMTKQTIRHWRERCWNEIQDAFKEKEISEDDKFRAKDELQKLVDEYNEKVKNLVEKKKSEII
ncbi:MAG: ribosome recycling factor [Parcubacteria group bacterium Licking1014_1]|nr:MAG: ribosome recycling factor [Parcubacteria group bacterium Licking1014_1]